MEWFSKNFGWIRDIGELPFKHELDENATELLEEVGIEEGQKVLDFGCGSGTYTIPAAKMVGEKGSVYALDIDSRALDKVEEEADRIGMDNIDRIDADGEGKIPLDDDSIDIMLIIDALREIDDKDTLFSEAFRMLKSAGTVCVYPMHVKNEKVVEKATGNGFNLEGTKLQEHILIFRKPG